MSYRTDNAVIMAAGTASRFAPLSYETPKALAVVRGEVLIERQIRQLNEAGINDVIIVTGYKSEMFGYLREKYGVRLVKNDEYLTRNNNGSIWAVREHLRNTYICSADNWFEKSPFESVVDESYYSAVYAEGKTDEWCLDTDEDGYITKVTIGGENAWHMLGHAFWSEGYSRKFVDILTKEYDHPETADKYWENIYMEHLDVLRMKIRKYEKSFMNEFDSIDELREFDPSYIDDTRSHILKKIARELDCRESEMNGFRTIKGSTAEAEGFSFNLHERTWKYSYVTGELSGSASDAE